MAGADLDGARVGIIWVGVMSGDQAPTGADFYPEEQADGALLARETPKGALIVGRAFHVT